MARMKTMMMKAFVEWEETVVMNDKGRRLVHYYLKDGSGRKVLAVVGGEKSIRHMSYAVTNQFLMMMSSKASPSSALEFGAGVGVGCFKWKSRREVIDWLSSFVSDSVPYAFSPMADRLSDDEDKDTEPTSIPTSKGLSSGKIGHLSKEFSWLGSSWNCRKKRKHYRSFCRDGITISVHDFVYVMADEHKRLIAYVEDLYEDLRANNMVVVRWFHKVGEVGILLPPDINEREIFFSLCLQDFSIDCIDGLTAVLSAQDCDKFQNEARHRFSSWEPYMCRRQIDNDDVKPFDITQLQGYWSQEVLRSMYATPATSLKLRLKITHGGSRSSLNGDGHGHKEKKQRLSAGGIDAPGVVKDVNKSRSLSVGSKVERHAPHLLRKKLLKHKLLQQQKRLSPGCHVEVLSQDSGMRGCWFRCVVLKWHHDKVKVRYQDIQDADDKGNLEEWVLTSRVALPDKLGIRLIGRPVVRPDRSQEGQILCSLDIGSVVDAWWHDGWWEGIMICKESEGKFRVYFPGEQRVSVFSLSDLRDSQDWVGNRWNHLKEQVSVFSMADLRHSQDWLGNRWNHSKERPDVASSLVSEIDRENCQSLSSDGRIPIQASVSIWEVAPEPQLEISVSCKPPSSGEQSVERDDGDTVSNLAQVCHLDNLNWSSSRKRRRPRELGKGSSRCKRLSVGGSGSSSSREEAEEESNTCGEFLLSKSLTVVDNENCKIGGGDPMLVAPMSLCSSLVMSQ